MTACWPGGSTGCHFPQEDHCYCKVGEFGHHDHCRTHAEQRSITLARQGDGWRKLPGSMLVYVRLEADDSVRLAGPSLLHPMHPPGAVLGIGQWIFAPSDGRAGYSAPDYDQSAQLRW